MAELVQTLALKFFAWISFDVSNREEIRTLNGAIQKAISFHQSEGILSVFYILS